MQFIDEADIYVKAGDGGAGAVAFRREKFVPRGGPAGGDGGDGADILLETDERLTTLLDFRFKREYRARNGEPGRGRDQNGHAAPELVLKVPPGTLVKDAETAAVIADLRENGIRYVLAKGGRGGLGNMNFATPTLQAPRFAQPGTPGEEKRVRLELRLLADVGLVGFPNAGKSTLVARLSRARPKIADYPFTTLQPHLGVVQYKDARSFVLTDLPGLIEGAAEGAGLGHRFLKHMQRCRVVVHLVDASSAPVAGRDLVRDFDAINRELSLFDPALGRKPQLVAANKVDVPEAREAAELFARTLAERGLRVHTISGATGEGLPALLDAIVRELDSASAAPLLERDLVAAEAPESAVGPAAAPLPAAAAVPVEALTEDDLAENARAPSLPDEREESAREKARRAPKPTGRRKDGVLKAKAVELETKGAMPHKSRSAKTRAAVQALEAAAPRTSGQRAGGKDLARAAATRRARKGTSASAKRRKT
jgi:GTP-binding protein